MNQPVIDFRYAPPSSWTNLALADDPYKTVVREDGALLYGFVRDIRSMQFARVFEFGLQAAHRPVDVTQTTETPRFPCVTTILTYTRAVLTLRSFAYQEEGRRSDVTLWEISLRPGVDHLLTGLHLTIYDRETALLARSAAPARVIFGRPWEAAVDREFDGDERPPLVEDERLPPPGEPIFLSAPHPLQQAHPAGFRPAAGFRTEPTVLRRGETLRGAIIVPQNHDQLNDLDYAWAEAAYATARQTWENDSRLALPFNVPDPQLMEMVLACARNILQAREIEDGIPVFQVGPTLYRGLWVVDGHFMLEAAHYLGFREAAGQGIDALLRRAKADGSIAIFDFHTKETGISLLTLVRQCELMGDYQRLRRLWPYVQRGVAYIQRLREEAYALPPDSPCYRLLPMSFGDGGLGGKRGEYTTIFWILAGLRGVAGAARRLGPEEDAVQFQAAYEFLLADFRAAAARDMQVLPDGTPFLPMNMPGSSDHVWFPDYPAEVPAYQRLTPASGTWAFCHAIYPGEVFAADDPLVANLLALYEAVDDRQGIPAGSGWLPYQALWGYHASFAAHAWLYAGRGDKAVDYLYAFANHATPTRVWREEQSLTATAEGQLWGDMPHNWASAEFVRLVRHLVIFERGNGIDLLPGVPPWWRRAGDVVRFDATPTRFGPVTLRLETVAAGAFTLKVALDPESPVQPQGLRVRLPATDVTVNGEPVPARADHWLPLPAVARTIITGTWLPAS